jgi:ATP/maltotriose-dependent transcriptional regulator MalT
MCWDLANLPRHSTHVDRRSAILTAATDGARGMLTDLLDRARDAYDGCDWDTAFRLYAEVAGQQDLGVADLAAMSDAAWWLGDTSTSLELAERAFHLLEDDGAHDHAAQLAIEMGFLWLLRGEQTAGSGWIHRAGRLLEGRAEGAAHGYLLFLDAESARARDDLDAALSAARQMERLGLDHGDRTLATVGQVVRGVTMTRRGHVEPGLQVLDEAMLAVHAGQVTPNWAGNLYCQLMALFMDIGDIPRARDWTEATERWCDGFSNAAMFRGICRVHQAQLMTLEGDWTSAEAQARQACRDLADMNLEVVAEGHYQLAEVCRKRGRTTGAEQGYERARELGRDPHPGLALLRLAQGRVAEAAAALDTALATTGSAVKRAPLLAARVDVATVQLDASTASRTAAELRDIAATWATPGLVAHARLATGTVHLLAGDPAAAVPLLRDACRQWHALRARHDLARARLRLAAALAAAGDGEAATRERALARAALDELGVPVESHLDHHAGDLPVPRPGGLTDREVDVLRLVASGSSNRAIADALTISERTVERHLSNIFGKLAVSSRTEAARVAFAHGLATPHGE